MKNDFLPPGALLSVLLSSFCQAVLAATPIVDVLLQDPSTDPAIHSMRIVPDRDTVPAGRITFRAANQSKDQVHELIVVRIKPGHSKLPYDKKKSEVEEKYIRHLGEISDLKPGASGAMTLNLKPGAYLLICNQPGHYAAGMATTLTVTK
jgi:uncharacterized cupredoxin-like copper-binding protein